MLDDVPAKPDAAIAVVDARPGPAEEIAGLLHLTAQADIFQNAEGGTVDRFHLIVRDETERRKRIPQFAPRLLDNVLNPAPPA